MSENKGVEAALQTASYHIDSIGGADDMTTPASKRTTPPAFQFYPSDFLASANVDEMSMTERGAYITLLSRAWLDNGLPTDLAQLARYARMKPAQFDRMWSGPLGRCFEERGGRLVSPRQERERKKQAEFRRRQSDNGKLGGRPHRNPEEPKPLTEETHSKARAKRREETNRDETSLGSSVLEEKEEPLDVEFRKFQTIYPAARRKGGRLVEESFINAVQKAGGVARLIAALANHVGSDQWSNPRLIPGMDVWLAEERWRQELPAAGAVTSSANNPKTAGNIPVLQRFIDRGRPAHD
jgi:uncharacterized protein YdaU (DUF1376 family)